MKKCSFKPIIHHKGFTLLELLAALVIFAILVLLVVPAYTSIIPRYQAKRAANSASGLMFMGRNLAASTNKPARVVIDCQVSNEPCSLSLYSAVYDDKGKLIRWIEMPDSLRLMNIDIEVKPAASGVTATTSVNNLYWAVFFPAGQVEASHKPMKLSIQATGMPTTAWELFVSQTGGRISLSRS